MSFFDDVEAEVRDYRSDGVSVRDYRLSLAETTSAGLGVEANRVGSPYAPLSVSELGGGGFVVQWTDGSISKGAVNRAPCAAIREVLDSAFEGRYDDPDEANFPEAAEVPSVVLHSEEAAAIARGEDADALPEMLDVLAATKETSGARLIDAAAGATRIVKRVVSSGGFRAECESTHIGFSISFDSLVWDGHGARAPFPREEVAARAARTVADFRALSEEGTEEPSGPWTVLLHPRVAESFVRHFLLGNLSGNAVANERSRFTAEDFRSGTRVLREDLSVRTRPLADLRPGSFRFTDEGVAARPVSLIEGGALCSPMAGLKSARKLDIPAAPGPTSIEGFEFGAERILDLEAALEGEKLLLVHSVLGMHTQDAVRGEYSLLCPQAVVYENGAPGGRAKGTLNGSMFDDLQSDALELVRFPGFATPGMRLAIEVS